MEKKQRTSFAGSEPNPFVLSLPKEELSYFEVLKPPRSTSLRSGLVTLQQGGDVGAHSTNGCEEILVILKGCGEVEMNGHGRLPVREGQVVFIPRRTEHNVFNTGTASLRYLYIVAPCA
ncbi:MAG TPA: cupin domain-containing protein [Syntrophales bacterium]|nr:cupin domain-containing protein [Syntrophales bacterium]